MINILKIKYQRYISEIEKDLKIESIWKDLVYCDRNIVYTPELNGGINIPNNYLMRK